ncbi:MAG TPA: YidB family protein [Steroidobacteraceae bacterium]|nr:YidB family protein [Steroidobacteraceae bacterium]
MGIFDTLGGPTHRSGGMSPVMMGLLGLLAYRTVKGKGRLADMLGTGPNAAGAGGPLSGGALGGGLKDLLDRFRQSGQGSKADSWVAKGPNHPIAPGELETALGEERIQWLMEQTGMPRDQLLAGLSHELPDAVDRLTPEGRLPTDAELTSAKPQ